jgi:hypothetical protein
MQQHSTGQEEMQTSKRMLFLTQPADAAAPALVEITCGQANYFA